MRRKGLQNTKLDLRNMIILHEPIYSLGSTLYDNVAVRISLFTATRRASKRICNPDYCTPIYGSLSIYFRNSTKPQQLLRHKRATLYVSIVTCSLHFYSIERIEKAALLYGRVTIWEERKISLYKFLCKSVCSTEGQFSKFSLFSSLSSY